MTAQDGAATQSWPVPLAWRPLWIAIGIPFVATRVALLLVGWFSQYLPRSATYPLTDVIERGWHFSPYRLLDIWGRWDTGWYMGIVRDGYLLRGDLAQLQSNVTFFPLYPMLVRVLLWPIPDAWQSDGVILLAGVFLSNLFLLGALLLIYLLALELTHDVAVAQRVTLYLLYFPSAFFLSCFYTEAAFLFFSLGALYAAQRRQWAWAAVAAALLGVTRPQGFLIIPILVWMYLSAAGWRLGNIRRDVAWLLLALVPFLLFLGWIGQMTGNFLAPMLGQQAYGRLFTWPWVTLFAPLSPGPLTLMDQALTVLVIVAAVVAFWRLPTLAYGLWVFAVILPFLFTGVLGGSVRFLLGATPVFLIFGQWGARPLADRLLQTLFLALQTVLMVAWSQFYYIA